MKASGVSFYFDLGSTFKYILLSIDLRVPRKKSGILELVWNYPDLDLARPTGQGKVVGSETLETAT